MLRVMVASCASDPLVACSVSFESPAGVLAADVTVNVCDEFAPTVIGDTGLVDVPAGRPEINTETDPLNPCKATTDTVTGTDVLPCTKLTEVDENRDATEREKSAGAVGEGRGGDVVEVPPPPQATIKITKNNEISSVSQC